MVSGFRTLEFKSLYPSGRWRPVVITTRGPAVGGAGDGAVGGAGDWAVRGGVGRGWAGAGANGPQPRNGRRHGRDYARLGLLLCVAFGSPFGERRSPTWRSGPFTVWSVCTANSSK